MSVIIIIRITESTVLNASIMKLAFNAFTCASFYNYTRIIILSYLIMMFDTVIIMF